MKVISIIGAGWLGKPLADYMASLGHKVFASRRTHDGADEITSTTVQGFAFDLSQNKTDFYQTLQKQGCEILIGCFPPGFRKLGGQAYPAYWKYLCEQAKLAGVNKLVMVSSTSVYPSVAETLNEEHASLSRSAIQDSFSDNAKLMLEAEQSVIDSGIDYAIVRCSGLFGPDRDPARFVTHMKQISQNAPANMIHRVDAVGAVSYMALLGGNHIVNATTPNTTSKAEFYQTALARSDLDGVLPTLVDNPDKHICPQKLLSLGYRFHYNHILDAL